MTTDNSTHVFEQAGLGVAPFRLIGVERRVGPIIIDNADGTRTTIGAPGQPMGSCDYCGNGIAECCVIMDAEGKRFVVGNVCVGKTGDRGLIDLAKRAIAKGNTERRHVREAASIAEGVEFLNRLDVRKVLASLPHPNNWRAEKGDTWLDGSTWMMKHAGNAGMLRNIKAATKVFEKATTTAQEG